MKLSDAITKGREQYPSLTHIHDTYITYELNQDHPSMLGEATGACALGFAMLGIGTKPGVDLISMFTAKVAFEPKYTPAPLFECPTCQDEHNYTVVEYVIHLNDTHKHSLDFIIEWLKLRGF